jgi:hypothetical protein
MSCIIIEVPLLIKIVTEVDELYIKLNISLAGGSIFLKGNLNVPNSKYAVE